MTKTKPLKKNSLNIRSNNGLLRALGLFPAFCSHLQSSAQAADPGPGNGSFGQIAAGVIGILETYG